MRRTLLREWLEARGSRRTAVMMTELGSGLTDLLFPFEEAGAEDVDEQVLALARRGLSGIVRVDGRNVFVRVHAPAVRLCLVGATHIAQCLGYMSKPLGYQVEVIDPRSVFLTAARFPGVTRHEAWPEEVLKADALDARTAVVTLAHDRRLDEPALVAALRSNAFYIGALGSLRTHMARRARLRSHGFAEDQLDRIHGPVGVDIGALTAAEIATSILAQLVGALRAHFA